ncbi:flavin-binding monooxygenase [Grosmannia clavigera kw1407]|uniref:L-ornithine N(5)-monooxygenase [NAD(P)H] n=1 Tax=Grosmannia clavigera (strain kw1407 / UAMH 11150) TaxID=655863 RepID=F0XQP8_GROCL|nr:flavin-binding monooxygenase [Grosmannia clavigera kw1407]EFW99824.1 flavin-binding monooxygenase [Grosmannia clavigera kw1407]
MGSVIENVPDASIKDVVNDILSTQVPVAQERSINPALAARIAARHTPKQKTWREDRPVTIIVIGAGIGGTTTAVLLSQKVPNATITVYDRLDKIGGTWAANVYPGVRCDVPSHVYQLSFEPNLDWSEYYPKGAEIQQYYERVVAKYGLAERFRLGHEVVRASWLPAASQWAVEVRSLATGLVSVDTADFLVSSQGRISEPKWPAIPGLAEGIFGGRTVHSARWPADLVCEGKRVAVIGAGASGQQVVSNVLRSAGHVDHYVRTKTYISSSLVGDFDEATADAPGGHVYTDEERRTFHEEPGAYVSFRRDLELRMQRRRLQGANVIDHPANLQLRERVVGRMLERLDGDDAWLHRITPDYVYGCKRPTPSPGYLEALRATPAVLSYITDSIVSIDATGIVTADGIHRPVDVIVAATGFENGYTTRFPLIGLDGVDLRDRWGPDSPIGYPESYLGVMAPGYPNYFTVLQAQANALGGSVPLQAEITATYIGKAIRKLQSQSYSALDPRQDATDDFNNLIDGFFGNKTIQGECRSWSKIGFGKGRVVLAWPGSFQHRVRALRDPRWEDFRFVRRPDAAANRFEHFGNGLTDVDESDDDVCLTSYLREYGELDPQRHHEYAE